MVARLDVTRNEATLLLALVRARHAELARMEQNLEEGEGMDLQRHNALKGLRPQLEMHQDLVMKLEGALAELKAGE